MASCISGDNSGLDVNIAVRDFILPSQRQDSDETNSKSFCSICNRVIEQENLTMKVIGRIPGNKQEEATVVDISPYCITVC